MTTLNRWGFFKTDPPILALKLLTSVATRFEDTCVMNQFIKNIFENVPLASRILFGISQKLDYKTLSRYMLKINEKQELMEILQEVSQCLKDILNYRLFAILSPYYFSFFFKRINGIRQW